MNVTFDYGTNIHENKYDIRDQCFISAKKLFINHKNDYLRNDGAQNGIL